MSAHTRPVMECRACRQHGPTRGRGLCSPCYQRHRAAGTLDRYEPLNAARNTGCPARPFRECPWCTRRHRSAVDACPDCQFLEAGLDEVPDAEDALNDGHWAVIHGVRRWIPTTREVVAA